MLIKIKNYLQQETVLSIAWILAIFSMFIVTPDKNYIGYIDWETLGLLFSLMIVMEGLKSMNVFRVLGEELLKRVSTQRSLEAVLIMMCFFTSMLITNDVALITFVPFALETLKMAGMTKRVIPVVVLQTVAANLGSMATPIGNPQNMYLYFQSGLSPIKFMMLTLPFTLLSLGLLAAFIFASKNRPVALNDTSIVVYTGNNKKLSVYMIMFGVCLVSLTKIFSVCIVAIAVAAVMLIMDRKILKSIDYSLLLTFVGFFIFVGNMARMPFFSNIISGLLAGNELITTIGISQIISNVPATLLLTGFTQDWSTLIIGSNIGGLGTMIASMASLISYKYITSSYPDSKSSYMVSFTVVNLIFLGANLGLSMII